LEAAVEASAAVVFSNPASAGWPRCHWSALATGRLLWSVRVSHRFVSRFGISAIF